MYLDKILLTFTHHLPAQQDDCRGLHGSVGKGELAGRSGRTNSCTVCLKKKEFLYVSRCRNLLSVELHPTVIWRIILCKKTAHQEFLYMDNSPLRKLSNVISVQTLLDSSVW